MHAVHSPPASCPDTSETPSPNTHRDTATERTIATKEHYLLLASLNECISSIFINSMT